MCLKASITSSKPFRLFFCLNLFFWKLQLALGQESTTSVSISDQTTSTVLGLSSTSIKNTVAISASTTPKPIVVNNIAPWVSIPLAGESFKLNITALENDIVFTVIVNDSPKQKPTGIRQQVSKAKRLLIGLDSEKHFNVDVVALTFSNDTDGRITFGNQIQDLSWNKRNGVLLPDPNQSYKWIGSGGGKNGSYFFVKFVRSWLTCDPQDVAFLLSPIKIWWLFDNDENATLIKGQTKASNIMSQKFEKQVEAPPGTTTGSPLEVSTLGTSLQGSSVSTLVPQFLTTSGNVKERSSTTIKSKTSGNSTIDKKLKSMSTTQDPKPEEIEILKSIEEDHFQGPVNMSLSSLLRNVSWVILKRCEVPNVIFRCNVSEYNSLASSNSSVLPFIWKILLSDKSTSDLTVNFPEYQLEPCKSAFLVGSIGNTKFFNALSGNRNPKGNSKSKNSGNVFGNHQKFEILKQGLIYFLFVQLQMSI